MKLLKKKTVFISMFLVFVLCLSFLLPNYINLNNDLATRNIDVNEIGTLSYEEKVSQLLNDFDVYSYNFDSTLITFSGEFTKDVCDFQSVVFLSTADETPVTQKYSTRLDTESEKFYVVTSYYQNNKLINSIEKECEPTFNEEKNDYFIELENGDIISVSESINTKNMNNCIAIVDDAAILLAAALAITVVVVAPAITQVVTTVITKVYSWVRSFFWWLKSLFVKTVVTTTVVEVLTPTITISQTTYKTKEVTNTDIKTKDPNLYFGAFADPSNGKMYFTILPISKEMAVSILYTPIVVPCIGDEKRTMLASTYTFYEYNALYIASVLGLATRTPAGSPEKHGGIGYFKHYHTFPTAITIGKNGKNYESNPHSFFGLSII